MKKVLVILALVTLSGCANLKYPGWRQVRIENTVPSDACQYTLQEACGLPGAECYNWYKMRAIKHKANTVVITQENHGVTSKGRALVIDGFGGGSRNATTNIIALADYYHCPD